VPSLIHEWHLPPTMFTTAFLWSSIGIMAGVLSAGPIGDRFGRRPLLLISLTIFGLASLLSATADSLGMLTLWRFFTGLGIGGGFSGAAALTGDYAPHRLRATMIMATFTGAPLGGFLGGQIVALLLPHFGWPMIFILGGAFPLLLVVALALWLPESPRFLAARQTVSPRHAALLQRLDIAPTGGRRSRHRAGQSDQDAVRSRLCLADRAVVDRFLLQPVEPVPVRLLDADRLDPDRHESVAGRVRLQPAGLRRDVCGPVSWLRG
jgi:MFS family permease